MVPRNPFVPIAKGFLFYLGLGDLRLFERGDIEMYGISQMLFDMLPWLVGVVMIEGAILFLGAWYLKKGPYL